METPQQKIVLQPFQVALIRQSVHPLKHCPKSTWTPDEDKLLFEIVEKFGGKNWPAIASHVPGRSGKQCRERYKNHLDPCLKKTPFTHDEDLQILRMVEQFGPKWALISEKLQGRTDNAIKNRYNSSLRRAHEEGRLSGGFRPVAVPAQPRSTVPLTPPGSPVIHQDDAAEASLATKKRKRASASARCGLVYDSDGDEPQEGKKQKAKRMATTHVANAKLLRQSLHVAFEQMVGQCPKALSKREMSDIEEAAMTLYQLRELACS